MRKSYYNENSKDRTIKYIKENCKRVEFRYTKDEYEERIVPAVEKSGMCMSDFIRAAIDEKIKRDGLE